MWGEAYRSGLRFGGLADVDWIITSLQPGMNVLEIGCGNGKTYLSLRKQGIPVVGLDLSPEALSLLSQNAKTFGIETTLEQGDARNLRFPNRSFDAVVAIHLLDALETDADRAKVVSEVFRVLNSRGQFFCEVFCVEDFRNGRGRRTDRNTYVRGYVSTTYFDEIRLRSLLSDLFEVEIWHQRIQKNYGTRCSLRTRCIKKS